MKEDIKNGDAITCVNVLINRWQSESYEAPVQKNCSNKFQPTYFF